MIILVRTTIVLALIGFISSFGLAKAQSIRYEPPLVYADAIKKTCADRDRLPTGHLHVNDLSVKPIALCKPQFRKMCLHIPFKEEAAEVIFDINVKGKPFNVRILKISNGCLTDDAALAVLASQYEKSPNGARDISRTLIFEFDHGGWQVYDEPRLYTFDKTPKCKWKMKGPPIQGWRSTLGLAPPTVFRCPPEYPEKCMRKAKNWEGVLIHYDISKDGAVENIRAIAATNACLLKAATKSVAAWKFENSEKSWEDLSTVVTFELF